jgi:hypothetical protein
MIRLLPLVLACALLAGLAGTASAGSRGRHCGLTPRIQGRRFDVTEARGHAACRTVKPTMTRYLRTFKFSRPWFCTLTHDDQFPWAAACAKGRIVVHAYAPS